MTFHLWLKRVADGCVRQLPSEPGNWNEDANEYYWTDGNNACDCNRFLYFERAAGADPDVADAMAQCGDTAYLLRVCDEQGNVLHNEFDR